MAVLPVQPYPVPQAEEATWEEWENTVSWSETTVPGIMTTWDAPTLPLPLELLPLDKH